MTNEQRARELLAKHCFSIPADKFIAVVAEALTAPRPAMDEDEAIPMILTCPSCGERHFDEGKFATKAHHTHACQGCGMVWRPAKVATVGVRFLPGYKNDDAHKPLPRKDDDVAWLEDEVENAVMCPKRRACLGRLLKRLKTGAGM